MRIVNSNIQGYIDFVRSGQIEVCKEQLLLADYIERCFNTENIYVNEAQLTQYLNLQKYFPFKLLSWEVFCFTLHNCTYKQDGQLRWPVLFIYVGRGAGKNGYLAFEDFCLLTPINGIKYYDIDIFATSEQQARTSFDDVYNVLEDNKLKLSKHFYWNKEEIINLKTKSKYRFRTSGYKTKDGGRPGKVNFDEYHAYENNKMIDVAVTGLGKKPHPRRTIITTDGDVRDGPLDRLKAQAIQILKGEIADNGLLPFMCRLDSDKEIYDKSKWSKANPSYPFFPTLQAEMQMEYADFLQDKIGNASFATKRMNRPQGDKENEVTSWDNILATNKPMPELAGKTCMFGIDYAKTTDFVYAGLLFDLENYWYWICHGWVCSHCPDLSRIQAPLKEWEAKGFLTFVNDVEINPDIPAEWIAQQAKSYNIIGGAMDMYRYTLLSKSLKTVGFDADKKGSNNIKLVRPSDEMLIAPTITSKFANQQIIWGDRPDMRWCTNNTKMVLSTAGNITYGKIEPKSRKTDGFKAFVAAATRVDELQAYSKVSSLDFDVYTY